MKVLLNPTFSFPFEIVRSKRKTLVIFVKSGIVEVKSPETLSIVDIYGFIAQKEAWILRKIAEQKVKLSEKLIIAEGRPVPFFGQERRVEVILVPGAQQVTLDDDRLLIYARRNTPENLEKLFHRWLQTQAREYMITQTIKASRSLGVEHALKEVVFRKTRSKWGHCGHDGTIQYNWLTMMAPKPVVDYLIAHESSHLLHMNHSRAFWQTVARLCPDYKAQRNWFRDNGHRLWT